MSVEVLYEDKHLICVVKPYGVLSQGNEKTKSIVDSIAQYLKEKGESDNVYVVHRLDKTTGGVMVFAKTKQAAAKLSTAVSDNKLHKTYLAVVSGEIKGNARLEDLLYHDKNKNKTYVVKRKRNSVKEAVLEYEAQGVSKVENQAVTLLKINLLTGRTHQIRVQFSFRGHPLVGDRKYGSTISNETIALWSYSIEFEHPFTRDVISISALPDSEIFTIF